ncbi:hypothetical protein [Rhodopirellula europaea]|uniref:hypothetical protein n=1 Tax=Rhodopirellula europaea TaxID=1263866 RepID=UPI003D2C2C0A
MKTVQIGLFFLFVITAAVMPQHCSAQNGVNFGIGFRGQSPHGRQVNLGLWREGAPPTGVLMREFGTTLTGLAPYVVPVIQSLTGAPSGSLLNPTGGDNENADRESCGEIVVVDNDPNSEARGKTLVAIQKKQETLFKKLGITDYEPPLKPAQVVSGNHGGSVVDPTDSAADDDLGSGVNDGPT